MDQSKEEINQESSADKKATWEKNASTNGPSTPFLGSYETLNTKKGTNLEQFEKNCMKDPRPFSFAFPSSLTSTSTNENRGIQPSSKKNKGKEPENPDSRKTLEDAKTKLTLTEHKQPPLQTNYDDIKPAITKGNLAKCFQTQEDFLAGIYLEIEKQQSITECFKLKSLDLSRQKITALNDIGLYFPVLEKLKISHNELTQLTGLPDSITYLQADDNKLSSIELAHLSKLQGLYLSHNHLSQFEHLSELKSLRKLDIGHNFIKSVKPFQPLDGLTHLYLNSNNLQRLKEFEEFANRDLEYLDLSFNRIESLDSIEPLSGLIELNAVDHNDIKMVQLARPLGRLCKLRLSFNRLKSFDISIFPEIRVLYLDDNQIERIMGAACIKRLESFSLRDQGRTKVDINIRYLRGARKLYLSGSPFQNLQYMIDFYSLTYLELCAADIEDLPPQFSKQMPNLATLYLSSNRIADIRPLRKLKYLQRLVLIDNRITGINEAISVVRQLKSLKYLDMR
ncbi:hypothetical protein BY458DRAFT_428044 [Sporodiniella umbellata]|nr:hypothetical protein BY458DRAFT_428044 [Sporodiniella umbellata]